MAGRALGDVGAFLSALAGGGGGGIFGGFGGALAGTFDEQYRCYSVAMLGKPEFENGDKIVLPPSALAQLTQLRVSYPMLFRVGNAAASRSTHCGVIEFSSEEGRVYMPHWVMQNLCLEEGAFLSVQSAALPKGTFVKFRPHKTDFIRLANPKAVLEKHLPSFSCLTVGDSICVQYAGKSYHIDVLELKPANAVSIIETDIEVDFAPPVDYVEPTRPSERAGGGGGATAGARALSGTGAVGSPIVIDDDSPSLGAVSSLADGASASKRARAQDSATAVPAPSLGGAQSPSFVPFSGKGYSLSGAGIGGGGGATAGGAVASPTLTGGGSIVGGLSSTEKKKQLPEDRFAAMRRAQAFQGVGHKLS